VKKVVASAGKSMALFSGGSRMGAKVLWQKTRICVASGATGLIFGRNMWQRPFEEDLEITERIKEILRGCDSLLIQRRIADKAGALPDGDPAGPNKPLCTRLTEGAYCVTIMAQKRHRLFQQGSSRERSRS
jgi:hypothetical protein